MAAGRRNGAASDLTPGNLNFEKQQDKEKRIWHDIEKRFAGSAAGKGRSCF